MRAVLGQERLQKPPRSGPGHGGIDARLVLLGRGPGKRQRDLAQLEIEQPGTTSRLVVVVAFRRGSGQQFNLPLVQSEPGVDLAGGGLLRAVVREEDP